MATNALKQRRRGATLVACPTCGRIEIELIPLANKVEEYFTKKRERDEAAHPFGYDAWAGRNDVKEKHTVRGFVSILGSKGSQSIESSKNVAGERTYKVTK